MEDRSLADRVETLEHRVLALETLPAKVDALTIAVSQLRADMNVGFSTTQEEMHVLHRIALDRTDTLHATTMDWMDKLHTIAMDRMDKLHAIAMGRMDTLHGVSMTRIDSLDSRMDRFQGELRGFRDEVISRFDALGAQLQGRGPGAKASAPRKPRRRRKP